MHLRSSRDAKKQLSWRGFTLVELMVVLVLIAIMTATILPEMRGTFEDALLRSTGRKLVSVFKIAYSRAVTVHMAHRIRFDLKQGRFVVEARTDSEEGGRFAPVRQIENGEGHWDTRISLEFRRHGEVTEGGTDEESAPEAEDESKDRPKGEFITFYPDGTAEGKDIVLRDRDGFQLALRINPTTARVQIVELERK